MRKPLALLFFAVPMLLLSTGLPPAMAEDAGRCRIVRMNGTFVEGDVKKTDAGYEVTVKPGIVVTLKKGEVKRVIPLGAPAEASETASRTGVTARQPGRVSDADIKDILGSDNTGGSDDVIEDPDMLAAVPTNEDSVQEMLRIAGKDAKLHTTPHFALVYTSGREEMLRLASRMESIYKWVLNYQKQLAIPMKKPDHKLEIYFFKTSKEYNDYQAVSLGSVNADALGFYYRPINRSAFYDLSDMPNIANLREQLKQPGIHWRQRQALNNRMQRWADFYNLTVIQHECAHHIHFNTGVFTARGDTPRWLVEGLACMFELPPTDAGGSLGAVNHARLSEFRQIYGTDYRRLGDLRMFIVDDGLWQGGRSYSLGWALNHFMWKKHRSKYARYMQLMAQREEDVEVDRTKRQQEFEDMFGSVDEDWTKKFVEFINDLQLRPSLLPE